MRVERARYLDAAVRTGSLRAAAGELGMSQPALSVQIQQLEEELDVHLLTRGRRGVVPTPAAETLLPALRRMMLAEDQVRDDAQAIRGGYAGTVQIGCVPALTARIAPVIGTLLSDHPGIRLTVREGISTPLVHDVRDGRLDFAAVTHTATDGMSGVLRQPALGIDLHLCLPASHPLTSHDEVGWTDFSDAPIVSMQRGTTLWGVLHENIADPRIVVETSSSRSARTMVASGVGVAVLAPPDGFEDVDGTTSVPIAGGRAALQISLIRRRDTMLSRAADLTHRLLSRQLTAQRTV